MRGGHAGDLLEAVDLRGALTHRDDAGPYPEDLGQVALQGPGPAGLDQADTHHPLGARPGQQPGDGGARDPQVASDHLHGLALDVVHGGRLVGAHEPLTALGGTAPPPGGPAG